MKVHLKLFVVLASLLLVMLPVCFAEQNTTEEKSVVQRQNAPAYINFPGLASSIAALLVSAGIVYVAIGAAVVVGGYLIYRITEYTWTYYRLYSYSTMTEHAYKHINDFPNIWKKTPSRKNFEKKCKENMNSKSKGIKRYVQKKGAPWEIGRNIAYNSKTGMITVGETNGKTIITCFRDKDGSYVKSKVYEKIWESLK